MKAIELPPWNDQETWDQIQHYFDHTFSTDIDFSDCRFLAENIFANIKQVDPSLQELCDATCTNCLEVCCLKATVWYDFRDLLFLYLIHGEIPDKQISRKAGRACCLLDHNGCTLQREQRPFICTWYVCQQQHELLEINQLESVDRNLLSHLSDIQAGRKLMEKCFLIALT